MDSLYFKVTLHDYESVKIEEWKLPHFYSLVHFHPEYQITYIKESKGFLYIGNHIYEFVPGDIFIIGPNIAHVFRNEDEYYGKNNEGKVDAVSVFFTYDSLASGFFDIPEAGAIKELLRKSVYGTKVPAGNDTDGKIGRTLDMLLESKGFEKILTLLTALHEISLSPVVEVMSLLQAPEIHAKDDSSRINAVYEYVLRNYQESISLDDISRHVNMSVYSFCRFFKTRTKKTFVQFVNEIRIGMACKLLMEGQMSITDIAYSVGFGNISNFIRQFKKINGVIPSEYQRKIRRI